MICVIGSTGMLGSAVGKYLISKYGEDNIVLTYRNEVVSYGKNKVYFNPLIQSLDDLPEAEYYVNCIGVIKPFMMGNLRDSIYINSIFPRDLSDWCNRKNSKLIQITTDCVFSGRDGKYTEKSTHDALDEYGKSKSLGEPSNCMVIRTSIIGEEIHKKASLVEWAKSQKGKSVNGFTNHLWNGITTEQYGKIIGEIIDKDLYKPELYHVFSNSITKFELLKLLNNKFKLDLTITPVQAEVFCDRTLSTIKDLNNKLNIPDLESQIKLC